MNPRRKSFPDAKEILPCFTHATVSDRGSGKRSHSKECESKTRDEFDEGDDP